jgi:hypothetical protein
MHLSEVGSLKRPKYSDVCAGTSGDNPRQILAQEGRYQDYLVIFPPILQKQGWRRRGQTAQL